MGKFIIGLLLGIIIGAGGFWYLQQGRTETLVSSEPQTQTMADAKNLLDAKLEALELQADKIQKDLAETGRVVRRKATEVGETVVDAAQDTGVTTAIKAKLAAHPQLSMWDISVSTSGGVVTLSGKVPSAETISQAMLIALQTDGVTQVISTLQIN